MKPQTAAPLDFCELCGKEIKTAYEIAYPYGHHGEPVQCMRCYSMAMEELDENSINR